MSWSNRLLRHKKSGGGTHAACTGGPPRQVTADEGEIQAVAGWSLQASSEYSTNTPLNETSGCNLLPQAPLLPANHQRRRSSSCESSAHETALLFLTVSGRRKHGALCSERTLQLHQVLVQGPRPVASWTTRFGNRFLKRSVARGTCFLRWQYRSQQTNKEGTRGWGTVRTRARVYRWREREREEREERGRERERERGRRGGGGHQRTGRRR